MKQHAILEPDFLEGTSNKLRVANITRPCENSVGVSHAGTKIFLAEIYNLESLVQHFPIIEPKMTE